jgi:hypothetical protein
MTYDKKIGAVSKGRFLLSRVSSLSSRANAGKAPVTCPTAKVWQSAREMFLSHFISAATLVDPWVFLQRDVPGVQQVLRSRSGLVVADLPASHVSRLGEVDLAGEHRHVFVLKS